MSTGNKLGPSETLRGLRSARRIIRRPVRRIRYASGVTFWTARSILSATVVRSSGIAMEKDFYQQARQDATEAGIQHDAAPESVEHATAWLLLSSLTIRLIWKDGA